MIRRLKSRLAIEPDYLCAIGTSATLGSDVEQTELLDYAEALFGGKFNRDAIISESRLSVGEFLGESLISYVDIVPEDKINELDPANFNRYEEYIETQIISERPPILIKNSTITVLLKSARQRARF